MSTDMRDSPPGGQNRSERGGKHDKKPANDALKHSENAKLTDDLNRFLGGGLTQTKDSAAGGQNRLERGGKHDKKPANDASKHSESAKLTDDLNRFLGGGLTQTKDLAAGGQNRLERGGKHDKKPANDASKHSENAKLTDDFTHLHRGGIAQVKDSALQDEIGSNSEKDNSMTNAINRSLGLNTHEKRESSDQGKNTLDRTLIEELTERQRIALPTDKSIGFAFGEDRVSYDQVVDILQKMNRDVSILGPSILKIKAKCSQPGSKEFNQELSDRRGVNTKEMALLAMKAGDVSFAPVDIVIEGVGSSQAKPGNRDYAEDRVVTFEIISIHKPPVDGVDSSKPKIQKELTDIPSKYTTKYIVDRDTATRLSDSPNEWALKLRDIRTWSKALNFSSAMKELAYWGVRIPFEVANRITEIDRWCRSMKSDKDPNKIFKVLAPYPLRELKDDLFFKTLVKDLLKQAGYEPKKMYREWLIHQFRKGAR